MLGAPFSNQRSLITPGTKWYSSDGEEDSTEGKIGEGSVRRCVAELIGRRLGAREVTVTPEFIGLDEFSVSGRSGNL